MNTIERYFEQYPIMKAMAFMYFQWIEEQLIEDEVNPQNTAWARLYESIEGEDEWKGGGHSGDCTQKPWACSRCMIENITSEAYTILLKFDPSTNISAPPNTDPRRTDLQKQEAIS
jgi:hypothetical protein